MEIGITSMQKNRGNYILEWLAFHMVAGVDYFYIYCHNNTDDTPQILNKLSKHYSIKVESLNTNMPVQLQVFQNSADQHMENVDWMAFLDGDEFLLPTQHNTIAEAIAAINSNDASAIGVYWMCYGSSGHLEEPSGLLLENFTRHSDKHFSANRHIKSLLKGRTDSHHFQILTPHFFASSCGTVDELGRRIQPEISMLPAGVSEHEPSYNVLRINHYTTQSYNFFRYIKQNLGAPDSNLDLVREMEWFKHYDTNDM